MKENETNTSTVRVEIKDWLFNAGIVGLFRILKNVYQDVFLKDNFIEFNETALENFENHFFDYFFNVYEKDSLWYKLTQFYQENFNLDNHAEIDDGKIQDFIKQFSKGLDSASYCTAYEIIISNKNHIKEKLKIVKDKKVPFEDKLDEIKEIYNFFLENKRIIQAKYVSYAVINKYWSGVSFLNKQQVKRNMFDLYRKDFVDPVTKFLNTPKKENPFGHCMGCNRAINKKTDSFEGLTWLKMDLDTSRKTSVYWNNNPDVIFCPVCYLVYTCVPAGFVTFRQKGLFINDNSSIERLIQLNKVAEERIKDIDKMENLEDITYTTIINMIHNMREQNLEKEVDNIQVVKFDNDKGYTFNLLSKQVIQVIDNSKKELNRLSQLNDVFLDRKNRINLYAEVIDRIYKNINLYPLIYLMTALSLRRKKRVGFADLIFKINMNYLGGHMSEKKIYAMKQLGLQLKKGYKDEPNKIQGIAYRLLNNLKTKKVNGFLDVVINCHMHIGKEVPTLFVECIDDIEKFQAYGYAFLLGLMGEEYKPTSKTENMKE